jgi:hypothetical protein
MSGSPERRQVQRFAFIRRSGYHASPKVIRAREMHVLNLGRWMLVYTPRDHWSNHL